MFNENDCMSQTILDNRAFSACKLRFAMAERESVVDAPVRHCWSSVKTLLHEDRLTELACQWVQWRKWVACIGRQAFRGPLQLVYTRRRAPAAPALAAGHHARRDACDNAHAQTARNTCTLPNTPQTGTHLTTAQPAAESPCSLIQVRSHPVSPKTS